MERYKPKQEFEIIDKDIVKLPDRDYHFHLSDLKENNIPVEMQIFTEIMQILNIDSNRITQKEYLLCLESIYKPINDLTLLLIEKEEENKS